MNIEKTSQSRWTVRGVSDEARRAIREVMEINNLTAGEAVSEAIETWFAGLPEVEEEDDLDG